MAVGVRPLAPWRLAAFDHLFENLPVPHRIHSAPETLVLIRHQLPGLDQTVERFEHKLFAVLDVVKDFLAKDKKTSIDPNIGLMTGSDSLHDALLIEFGQMKIDRRMNGDEAGNFSACLELIDHFCKRRIGQSIAVVGQEDLFILDKTLDRKQARSDISPDSGVDERNPPFGRLVADKLNFGAVFRNHAIAAFRDLVIQEVILDNVSLVSKTQDKIMMAILAIILHDMPQDRIITDRNHWFRNALRIIANSRAQSATKQNNLHDFDSLGSAGATLGIVTTTR